MKIRRIAKICAIISVLCLCLQLTGCGGGERLKVGFFPNITHSQALCGISLGTFDKALGEALSIGWYGFNAGPSAMESMRAGHIDIAYIGPVPAISGYETTDGGIKIIAGVTSGGSLLVARRDSGVESVEDLGGKMVAVPQFGNTQDILLRGLLDDAGLAPIDDGGNVQIVQQANANIKLLLENGSIDAALVPEPWGSAMEAAGCVVVLDSDDIMAGDYPVAVLVVRTEYLDEHRDSVKLFLEQHIATTRRINDEADYCATVANDAIGRLTGISLEADVLSKAFDRMGVDYTVDLGAIDRFIDICRSQGLVRGDMTAEMVCDTSVLEEILAEQND